MKINYILFLICCTHIAFAQNKIKVNQVTEKMSQGYKAGLSVMIPEANLKEIEKIWKKRLKDFDGKVSESKGELIADNAMVKGISENTVDIYSQMEKVGDDVKMIVYFDLGGSYLSLSTHPDQYAKADDIIEQFAIKSAKEAVSQEIEVAAKALKYLEQDQEKLKKEKEDKEREIEQWKKDISKAETDIKKNLQDQETQKAAVSEQKKVVADLNKKLNGIK